MIRHYKKADAQRCSQIMRDCLEIMDEYEPKLKDLLWKKRNAEWLDDQYEHYDGVWVYERGGEVLGVCSLNGTTIEGLYVDPENHHEDIGGELLQYVEDIARTHGVEQVNVESSFFAEAFYQQKGYHTLDKGQVELGDFTVLFIRMEKLLA